MIKILYYKFQAAHRSSVANRVEPLRNQIEKSQNNLLRQPIGSPLNPSPTCSTNTGRKQPVNSTPNRQIGYLLPLRNASSSPQKTTLLRMKSNQLQNRPEIDPVSLRIADSGIKPVLISNNMPAIRQTIEKPLIPPTEPNILYEKPVIIKQNQVPVSASKNLQYHLITPPDSIRYEADEDNQIHLPSRRPDDILSSVPTYANVRPENQGENLMKSQQNYIHLRPGNSAAIGRQTFVVSTDKNWNQKNIQRPAPYRSKIVLSQSTDNSRISLISAQQNNIPNQNFRVLHSEQTSEAQLPYQNPYNSGAYSNKPKPQEIKYVDHSMNEEDDEDPRTAYDEEEYENGDEFVLDKSEDTFLEDDG